MKRRYKQNLLETFYIVTNSFTLSLDSDPQTIRSIMKNFQELQYYLLKIYFKIVFGKVLCFKQAIIVVCLCNLQDRTYSHVYT